MRMLRMWCRWAGRVIQSREMHLNFWWRIKLQTYASPIQYALSQKVLISFRRFGFSIMEHSGNWILWLAEYLHLLERDIALQDYAKKAAAGLGAIAWDAETAAQHPSAAANASECSSPCFRGRQQNHDGADDEQCGNEVQADGQAAGSHFDPS